MEPIPAIAPCHVTVPVLAWMKLFVLVVIQHVSGSGVVAGVVGWAVAIDVAGREGVACGLVLSLTAGSPLHDQLQLREVCLAGMLVLDDGLRYVQAVSIVLVGTVLEGSYSTNATLLFTKPTHKTHIGTFSIG